MEMEYAHYGLVFSLLANLALLFTVRALKAREYLVLKTSEEMIAISERFTEELQLLKNDTEEA
tara:strand:+ start:141 stop:329 length:189 start_codon:yes stop_codon:yes gene_type:complete